MNDANEQFPAEALDNLRAMWEMARSYRDDPDFRARLDAEPRTVLADGGIEIEPAEIDLRVWANTEDVFYVALPPDPNIVLLDESLQETAGGTTAGTAACAVASGYTSGCPPENRTGRRFSASRTPGKGGRKPRRSPHTPPWCPLSAR